MLPSCEGLRMPWDPPQTSYPTLTPDQQPQPKPVVEEYQPQPSPAAESSGSAPRVLGGYYSWCTAQPFNKIRFENYTYIVHAFLGAGNDGGVQYNPARKIPSRELTALAHQHKVKVLISLGGGRNNYFDRITVSQWARKRFISSAVTVVEKYGYDGIDLDWEYPQNEASSKRWAALLSDLRAALDRLSIRNGKKYMLTAAVGPVKWYAMWIPTKTVREKLDFLHIMTYNYCGIWGGPAGEHAPIYSNYGKGDIASSLRYWTDVKGVPKDKLVIGLPFYSYIFKGYQPGEMVDPKNNGGEKEVIPVSYNDIDKKLTPGIWDKSLDDSTRTQWYRCDDGRSFMVIDGPEAIRYKTLWILKNGYRGAFCWAMRQDVSPYGATPLSDAMATAFFYYMDKYARKN